MKLSDLLILWYRLGNLRFELLKTITDQNLGILPEQVREYINCLRKCLKPYTELLHATIYLTSHEELRKIDDELMILLELGRSGDWELAKKHLLILFDAEEFLIRTICSHLRKTSERDYRVLIGLYVLSKVTSYLREIIELTPSVNRLVKLLKYMYENSEFLSDINLDDVKFQLRSLWLNIFTMSEDQVLRKSEKILRLIDEKIHEFTESRC